MNTGRVLRSVTDLIVRCLDPDAIVVFGSVAQGRARPDSDLDLFVIGRFTEPRSRRGLELRGLVGQFAIPIDLHLMTATEFEAEARQPFSLARTVQQHGIRVYEKGASRSRNAP